MHRTYFCRNAACDYKETTHKLLDGINCPKCNDHSVLEQIGQPLEEGNFKELVMLPNGKAPVPVEPVHLPKGTKIILTDKEIKLESN